MAAHICAAAPKGPRYDASQTKEQRTSPENGIWLCQTCSRFIDRDEKRHTVKLLQEWKHDSEQAALREIETRSSYSGIRDQIWTVPYQENAFFVGRDSCLSEIRERLKKQNSAAIGQAIRGLGGIGKTETAVAYAYQFKNEYDAVFWVRADTALEIESGFITIYQCLWPDRETPTPEDAVKHTLRWLNENSGWLLVFDNADNPELLKPYIPTGLGHVLLTSRSNALRNLGISKPIELPPLAIDDAVTFLLESTGREDAGDEEIEAAKDIAEELGGLPLALEQAASYIEQGASFADYLISFRKQSISWLEEGTVESRGYPDTVATTWLLNFEAVEKESAASAELLKFTSFVGTDEVPYELLINGSSALGTILSEALDGADEQPLNVNKLLNPLARYSLISISENRTYSTHRLVQEVTKHAMGMDARRSWTNLAVRAINVSFPNPDFSNWSQCKRLAPHAETVAKHVTEYSIENVDAGRVCACLGFYLSSKGQYRLAEPLYLQALEICRTTLGEDHPTFATGLNNLALLYRSMGRYEEAEPLFQQSMEIRRRALGEVHPTFATSLNNLAMLYSAMGCYDEVEPLYQQSMEIRRTALGEDHPSFATSLINLAMLYSSTGRYDEAEPLYLQALEINRTALGEDHPDFATNLNNLAMLYESMGRYEEAEPLMREAFEICRTALGEDHPDFATNLNSLAGLYRLMGRYEEAEPLYLQALEICRTTLGEDHPTFATSLINLASLYYSMGRYEEAEPLYLQALEIYRTTLGKDHPYFATNLNSLAGLYRSMGRYEEAEPLIPEALEICRTTLGEDHPDFARSLNYLAMLYESMGRYEEAERLFQQSMEINRTTLGEDHPTFAVSLNNLAMLYSSMGRYEEAEQLFQQSMEIRRTVLGEDHPDFATSLNNLAGLYDLMGRYEEAEPLFQQSMEIRRTALGENHPDFATSLNNYEILLRKKTNEPPPSSNNT